MADNMKKVYKDRKDRIEQEVIAGFIAPKKLAFNKSISFYPEDEDDLDVIKEASPHLLDDSKAERFARKLAVRAIDDAGFQAAWAYAYPDKENESEE